MKQLSESYRDWFQRLSSRNLVAMLVTIGAVLLIGAYWAIFSITSDMGSLAAFKLAAQNSIPALALGLVAHAVLDRFVWPKSLLVKLFAQVPGAILFALIWYMSIILLQSFDSSSLDTDVVLTAFMAPAFIWQMFQGVTLYGLAALASLAISLTHQIEQLKRRIESAEKQQDENDRPSVRSILVKTQDETQSVEIENIVVVTGAGDYSELVLKDQTILSTSRLGEFEARLPEDQFIRAHRSHLVRIAAIARTEPAGNGRTMLHLENGENLITSRSGSRLLKEVIL
ncbi:MAG: LytTR family DNA-binding domain-containing protein [Pseudomonadota bacterium]